MLGSKVMQGQPGSTRGQIAQECSKLPNLVGRTPDQCVVHAGVKGHVRSDGGQLEVKLLRNAL